MNGAIKKWIRPLALPGLHAWQRFHDYSLGALRDLRDRKRILRSRTLVVEDIHGVRFVLYPYDRPHSPYLYRHPHDTAEFEAITRLVHQGDIVFDIGANIGIYSVPLSRLCGPEGRVWAFEPVPETYWRLRETLALNRCENVVPLQAAMCDKAGRTHMTLFEPEYAEWNTLATPSPRRLNGKFISPSRSVEVQALALDSFCETQEIQRINLLKVDVEGFEPTVFQGAGRLLNQHRIDYICFEIAKQLLATAGFCSRQVFAVLESHGYASYRFDTTTTSFHGPVTDTREEWTNFFASWRDLSTTAGFAHVQHATDGRK